MSAVEALDAARSAGVKLRIDGGKLALRADAKPPHEVVEQLKRHKADIIVLLRQQHCLRASPGCPADAAERDAIIAEGIGVDGDTAVEADLAAAGHQSWRELSQAQRCAIESALDRLSPPTTTIGTRLIERTRAIIASDLFYTAVAYGWDMTSLFGVAPVAPVLRVGEQGLVPQLVFSRLPVRQIQLVTADHAFIEYRTGSELRFDRFKPALQHAIVWWECDALVSQPS